MVEKVMGNFCVKMADRSALAKECMRLYSELVAEKIELGLSKDIAMKYLIERDNARQRDTIWREIEDKNFEALQNS